MKTLRVLLLCWCSFAALAEEPEASEVAEQCVATFIFEGYREDVVLWQGMFSLDTETILKYLLELQRIEDEDALPRDLLAQAIEQCRGIMDYVQSSQADE